MTTTEASRLIGCHPRHVRNLINQGKLRVTMSPRTGRYNVTLEEVRHFLRIPQGRGWPRGKSRNDTHGVGLGTGRGQQYEWQNGEWIKTAG